MMHKSWYFPLVMRRMGVFEDIRSKKSFGDYKVLSDLTTRMRAH